MKNLIKIAAFSSLLIIACLLIGSCGGGGEQFVSGQGKVDIHVQDFNTSSPLQNVTIVVTEGSATGKLIDTINNATDAQGNFQWLSPVAGVGTTFFFTFTLANYSQSTAQATPNLTGPNVSIIVKMTHL